MLQMLKRAAASVANAGAGKVWLFFDTDGIPKVKDEAGTVTSLKGVKGDTGADGATGAGVPAGGTAGQSLRKVSGTDFDVAWVTPSSGSGTGDVEGPASSTTNHIALFADTTGKAIKDGGALAAVAASNSYNDLDDKPTIPAAKTRQAITSASTLTLVPTDEFASISALAANLSITASGTWTAGDAVLIEINAITTDRTLTWDAAKFVGLGGTLPTTAKAGKVMALAGYYSAVTGKINISLPAAVLP